MRIGASGIMIVYDITRRKSLADIDERMKEIKENSPECNPRILIGNKCDEEKKREVTYEEGEKMASKYGMAFLETSTKTGRNVNKAFMLLIRRIKNGVESGSIPANPCSFPRKRAVVEPAEENLLFRCICF